MQGLYLLMTGTRSIAAGSGEKASMYLCVLRKRLAVAVIAGHNARAAACELAVNAQCEAV
jgi:hypothetical protein